MTASDNRGMRLRLGTLVLVLAMSLGLPSLAAAASAPSTDATQAPVGALGADTAILTPPIRPAPNWTVRPVIKAPTGSRPLLQFTSDAAQALQAAESTPGMRALHRHEHPLQYVVDVWVGAGPRWEVFFSHNGSTVAEVDVSPAGRATGVWTGPLSIAVDGRGHYGGLFDSPWVVLTFCALFLVPFVNPRRARRMAHLDAALLLATFGLPYYLFDHTHFYASFYTIYPLLLLVMARMLFVAFRGRGGSDAHAPRWPMWFLAGGLLGLVAARITLDLCDPYVIDVGVASMIGAQAIAHGQPLYTTGLAHGDTYGPIAYLAYLPFEAVFPWQGVWRFVAGAHWAAISFDVATIIGLLALGTRLRPGTAGRRLGLTLAWAWAASPATLFTLMFNSNDGLLALLFVLALLVYASPVGRGAMLGLAAAAKLFPAILLPLFAAGWQRRSWRESIVTVAIFGLVVVAAFAGFIPPGGLHQIYERTIGFQLDRTDVFSIWALYPSLDWLRTIVEVAVCLLAASMFFLPPRRTLAQVAGAACALTIAVELPAQHWFYFYLTWMMPFAIVALLAREAVPAALRHLEASPGDGAGEPIAPAPIAAPAG